MAEPESAWIDMKLPTVTMNYYLSVCLTIIYWLLFPIIYILSALLSLLLLVLSPLFYLAHYIAYGFWYPFSLIPNFEVSSASQIDSIEYLALNIVARHFIFLSAWP